MKEAPVSDRLFRKEAAEYLGVKPQTLSAWASNKRYPLPYVKVGSRVQYRLSDLQRFLESRVVNGVQEPPRQ